MLDKTLEAGIDLKFIVYIIVVILNFGLGIVISFFWKSWKNFKEDQKIALSDFFTNHEKEHNFLFSKCAMKEQGCNAKVKEINESIIALFAKEDDDRDRIIKAEQNVKNMDEKLKDHIRRCEVRDQCHDRRKDDKK